jgi:membrane-bound lytic murein transglycosylase D
MPNGMRRDISALTRIIDSPAANGRRANYYVSDPGSHGFLLAFEKPTKTITKPILLKRFITILSILVGTSAALSAWAAPPPEAPVIPAFEEADEIPMPDPDLWLRIRMGFMLEPLDTPIVMEHEAWYSSRPEYIRRFVERGSKYLHHIVEEVEKRGMPMEIALLPIVESAFNPKAYSRSHASGLWQFIPSTGKSYGLKQDWYNDHRRDVVAGTDAALNYLQKLYGMFGSWELAIAAYNCGEGCVGRAIAQNQKRGLPTDYLSLRLPPETMHYVPKLIAVKNIILSPGTYGVELESVPDTPYFITVPAPAKIDVRIAAKMAGMPEEDFVALNPNFNKPVAMVETGRLLLPHDKADLFRSNLESYDKPLVTWTTYQAKNGESIDAIAKRHSVSAASLKLVNNLKMNKKGRLVAAQPVLIPTRASFEMVKVADNPSPRPEVGAPAVEKAAYIAPAPAMPSTTAPAAPKVAIATAAPAAAAAPSRPAIYKVRPGDTLYSIAQRFGTTVDALTALNRLASSAIQVGLTLKLR